MLGCQFYLPVSAIPMTSCPSNAGGHVHAWMGEGSLKSVKATLRSFGILSWSKAMTGVTGDTSLGVVIVILCFWRKALASESEGGVAVNVGAIEAIGGSEVGVDDSEDSCFRLFFSFFSFFLSFEDKDKSPPEDASSTSSSPFFFLSLPDETSNPDHEQKRYEISSRERTYMFEQPLHPLCSFSFSSPCRPQLRRNVMSTLYGSNNSRSYELPHNHYLHPVFVFYFYFRVLFVLLNTVDCLLDTQWQNSYTHIQNPLPWHSQ